MPLCLLMQGASKLIQNLLFLILFFEFQTAFYFLLLFFFNLAFIVIFFLSLSWVNAPRLLGN